MLSLNLLVYGFTAPIAGGLSDRWKPRLVVPVGITILGVATACCAFASELWHFYVLFGILMPFGTAFSGWPVIGPAIANWFKKRRGLIMGFAQIGGGLSFTYGMFVEFVISQLGWRYAYFTVAGILISLYLPLYLYLFRQRPEKKYAHVATLDDNQTPDVEAIIRASPPGITLGKAVRDHRLWFLIASQSFYWGLGSYLVLAHQVKYAQDIGYSSSLAASVFGLFGVAMGAGQLCGFLSDVIGREKTMSISAILSVGALIALVLVNDVSQSWLLYIYAICFGYGAGLFTPTMMAGAADIFYGRSFGAISGLILTGLAIGGVVGPWLGGYIYDMTGDYSGAFIFAMACLLLSCVSFWIASPRKAIKAR
jgi:MFS family permease